MFKLGIIGLDNQSGLGRLLEDFNSHFDCNLLIPKHDKGQYKRYKNAIYSEFAYPSDQEIMNLCKSVDILLTFETPFNANAYKIAHSLGKPTICITMYECMNDIAPFWEDVDLFISCSVPDLDEVMFKNKIYLPIPIDTDRIPFIQRIGRIRKIVHNAGFTGYRGRNGSIEVAKFINRCNDDIELILRSQQELDIPSLREDKRIIIYKGETKFEQLYAYGDLFFFPCRFNGLCLPVQEALASGMPVMTSELPAWTGFIPKEWQIPMIRKEKIVYGKLIDVAYIDIDEALKKFEWFKSQDLSQLSLQARKIAEKRSWRVLYPKYLTLFNTLLQ